MCKILVAYASKYGATEEIAERIGLVISQSDNHVDILPVEEVTDLKSYDAAIIGSAVYIGQWRQQAVKFLKKNRRILASKKVWLFSSGPSEQGDPSHTLKEWKYPATLHSIIKTIHPRDITLFHGYLNTAKLNFIERFMVKKIKASTGDFRDWHMIENWASGIAKSVNY